MKTKLFFITLLFLVALFFDACRPKPATKPADVDYYTCSMHPSVRLQDPREKCPICHMDTTPVKKKGDKSSALPGAEYTCPMHPSVKSSDPKGKCPICGMPLVLRKNMGTNQSTQEHVHAVSEAVPENQPTEFTVSPERQQRIGVTYETVKKKALHRVIRTVGTVAADRQKHWDYVSRIEGYVQKVEVAARGEKVKKGQPLLTIYSPDLLTAQGEYLDWLRLRDEAEKNQAPGARETAQRMIDSSRRRLKLWNVDDSQILELENTRKAEEKLTLFSPFDGVIVDLAVDQGRRIMPGDHLVDIADLSRVWVWATFYPQDLPYLKPGARVKLTSGTIDSIVGQVALVDPFLNPQTRTAQVRIDVDNQKFLLRPEMFLDVELAVEAGEQLAIPVGAVLPTGDHQLVFLDRTEGKLEPRYVELGEKFGNDYIVKKGLKEGDRVVTSANFLIDAESKLQGALKSW